MPTIFQIPTFIQILEFIGTFAFAISGIRLASAKQFDWFGAYVAGVPLAVVPYVMFYWMSLHSG